MAEVRYRIGAGGKIFLVLCAVLFDALPLVGVFLGIGLLMVGGAKLGPAAESFAKCVPGHPSDGVFSPGVTVANPYEDCEVKDVKAMDGVAGYLAGGVASLALALPAYFLFSLILPPIAFFFFSTLFLIGFRYNPFGITPRKVVNNLKPFLGELTPFLNLLPWITFTTLGHIRASREEDREAVLGTQAKVSRTGFKMARIATRSVPLAGAVVGGAALAVGEKRVEKRALAHTPSSTPKRQGAGILPFERFVPTKEKTAKENTSSREKNSMRGEPSRNFDTLEKSTTPFDRDRAFGGVHRV